MKVIPKRRSTRIAAALAAVPVVLGMTFLGAYFAVQSGSFKGYLAKTLSSVLGERVDIGQDIRISSIFPQLSVVLPNVKMRPTSFGSNVERARIDNLVMTVTPGVVFSGGEEGRVDIHVDQITLLSAASDVASPVAVDADLPASEQGVEEFSQNGASQIVAAMVDKASEASIAKSIGSLLQRSSTLDITLTTDRFVYLARDVESGNMRHEITDLTLESSDLSVRLNALVDVHDQAQRAVSAVFTSTSGVSELSGNTPIRGELSAEIHTSATHANALHDGEQVESSHTFSTPIEIADNLVDFLSIEYHSPISWVRGTLGFQMGTDRPQLQADLEVRKLQLTLAGDQNGQSVTDVQTRLFPFDTFAFRIPESIDAQIDMYLGAIRLDTTPVINGNVQVSMTDGKIQLRTQDLTVLGGPSELTVDIATPTYGFVSMAMKLESDDIQLNRIRSPNSGEPMISKGKADLIMALKGSGPSPGHIAASSSGYVLATADSAEINQKYSTLIDQGVVSWGLGRISVLTSKSDSEKALSRLSDPLFVPCASVKLYLNDGRAEVSNGAIIELPQNTLYSSGYINLLNEQMGFAFRAKKKSLFEWSAISIARFAEVSGTLANPSVTLNKNELAKQGILSTSSIMWGPLPSLVYTLAESGLNNSQSKLCRKSIE